MTALMRIGRRGQRQGAAALSALAGRGTARRRDRGAAGAAGRHRAVHVGAAAATAIPTCASSRSSWCAACRPRRRRACCASLLEHEPHPNVCASAVDALAEVGTREALPALRGVRPALRRDAVPAVRDIDRHRAHFGRERLRPAWRDRTGDEDRCRRTSRQEDVRRLCEFLYRRTGMLFAEDKRYYIDRRLHGAHRGHRRAVLPGLFRAAAVRCRPRGRAPRQCLHGQRDLFLSARTISCAA